MTQVFIELGGATLGLAILARLSSRWSFSAIPLYLLAGLALGNGGLFPLNVSKEFIEIGSEIGVLLLLFMLGLEYSGEQLKNNLAAGASGGVIDFFLNFPPGLAAGLLLGWKPMPAVLLGGVTYISSSGIVAKVISDLSRSQCPETPVILSILVIEDLVMAVYLPLTAVLIAGGGPTRILISVAIAVVAVLLALFAAIRYGKVFSPFLAHQPDEVILLTGFGIVLLVGGLAQKLQVSAAIGAFLVGIAFSGPLAEQSHRLIAPLRDLFAAIFFFFFGLEIDPRSLPPVLAGGDGAGRGDGGHEDSDRLLVNAEMEAGRQRAFSSGTDAGGARRIFDCDCGFRRGAGAAAWRGVGCVCADHGDSGPGSRAHGAVRFAGRLRRETFLWMLN